MIKIDKVRAGDFVLIWVQQSDGELILALGAIYAMLGGKCHVIYAYSDIAGEPAKVYEHWFRYKFPSTRTPRSATYPGFCPYIMGNPDEFLSLEEIQVLDPDNPMGWPLHDTMPAAKRRKLVLEEITALRLMRGLGGLQFKAKPGEKLAAKVSRFVDYALDDRSAPAQWMEIIKVSPRLAKKLLPATGLNLVGYKFILETGHVQHAWDEHGDAEAEGKRGQPGLNRNDFVRAILVMASPDKVYEDRPGPLKRRRFLFQKKIEGWKFTARVFLIKELRKGNKSLALITLYKHKK